MGTKERLKDAKKAVNDALKAEKQKGIQFQAFVQLHKASDHCERLLKEGGWQEKQRKELSKLREKAGEGIQRLTFKLTPDELDDAMALCAPADDATVGPEKPTSFQVMGGDVRDQTARSTFDQRSTLPIAPTLNNPKKPPVMLRAKHAWDESQGANPGTDLLFNEGEVFQLVSDTEPGHGWWTGFNDDGFMEGIFPANYVEKIEGPIHATVEPARVAVQSTAASVLVDPVLVAKEAPVVPEVDSGDEDFESFLQEDNTPPPLPGPETYRSIESLETVPEGVAESALNVVTTETDTPFDPYTESVFVEKEPTPALPPRDAAPPVNNVLPLPPREEAVSREVFQPPSNEDRPLPPPPGSSFQVQTASVPALANHQAPAHVVSIDTIIRSQPTQQVLGDAVPPRSNVGLTDASPSPVPDDVAADTKAAQSAQRKELELTEAVGANEPSVRPAPIQILEPEPEFDMKLEPRYQLAEQEPQLVPEPTSKPQANEAQLVVQATAAEQHAAVAAARRKRAEKLQPEPAPAPEPQLEPEPEPESERVPPELETVQTAVSSRTRFRAAASIALASTSLSSSVDGGGIPAEAVKGAVKEVQAGLRLEKQPGRGFDALVQLMQASKCSKALAYDASTNEKQRGVLMRNADKADASIAKLEQVMASEQVAEAKMLFLGERQLDRLQRDNDVSALGVKALRVVGTDEHEKITAPSVVKQAYALPDALKLTEASDTDEDSTSTGTVSPQLDRGGRVEAQLQSELQQLKEVLRGTEDRAATLQLQLQSSQRENEDLRTQNEKLVRDLQAQSSSGTLGDEIVTLREEADRQRQRADAAEHQMTGLKREKDNAVVELQRVTSSATDSPAEYDDKVKLLQQQLAEASRRTEELQEEADRQRQRADAAEHQMTGLKREKDNAVVELQRVTSSATDSPAEYDDKVKLLQQQLAEASRRTEELQEEANRQRQRADAAEHQMTGLKREKDNAVAELQRVTSSATDSPAEYDDKVKLLQQQLAEASRRTEEWKLNQLVGMQDHQLRSELAQTRTELQASQKEVVSARLQRQDEADAELCSIRQQLVLSETVGESELKRAKLEFDQYALQEESRYKRMRHDYDTKIRQLADEYEQRRRQTEGQLQRSGDSKALPSQAEHLDTIEAHQLRFQLQQAEAEAKRAASGTLLLQEQVESADRQISSLSADYQKLHKQLQQQVHEVPQLKLQLEQAQVEAKRADSERLFLQDRLDTTERELSLLQGDHKKQLEQAQSDAKRADSDRLFLQDRLDTTERDLSSLRTEYRQLQLTDNTPALRAAEAQLAATVRSSAEAIKREQDNAARASQALTKCKSELNCARDEAAVHQDGRNADRKEIRRLKFALAESSSLEEELRQRVAAAKRAAAATVQEAEDHAEAEIRKVRQALAAAEDEIAAAHTKFRSLMDEMDRDHVNERAKIHELEEDLKRERASASQALADAKSIVAAHSVRSSHQVTPTEAVPPVAKSLQHAPQQQEDAKPVPPSAGTAHGNFSDITSEIRQLASLRREGIITEAEFLQGKTSVLDSAGGSDSLPTEDDKQAAAVVAMVQAEVANELRLQSWERSHLHPSTEQQYAQQQSTPTQLERQRQQQQMQEAALLLQHASPAQLVSRVGHDHVRGGPSWMSVYESGIAHVGANIGSTPGYSELLQLKQCR